MRGAANNSEEFLMPQYRKKQHIKMYMRTGYNEQLAIQCGSTERVTQAVTE